MLSILIMTHNEEVNISSCLASAAWSDDVVVLDSISSDSTKSIAINAGARVYERSFDNYAAQRMHALTAITYKHDWILMLDADERVTTDLREELLKFASVNREGVTMGLIRRRDYFMGRWIRRSSGYPTWFGRLIRIGHVRVERHVNEEYHTDGLVVQLRHHLDHFPFNKGLAEWTAKHNRYSTMEAATLSLRNDPVPFRQIFAANAQLRRIALKRIIYSLPFRPAVVFFGLYIVRGGFLEGWPGLGFCTLRAWYEFLINCKRREIARRNAGLSI